MASATDLSATDSAPDLRTRTLGRGGLEVTVLGLGCNNLGRKDGPSSTFEGTRAVVDAALEAGVTFFDVADVYGAVPGRSEEYLGRALAGRRDDVVIGTKFGMSMRDRALKELGPRAGARYLTSALEASLRRLGTDRVDLFQLHTPSDTIPLEETLTALDALVRDGKVRTVGHSNLAGWQIGAGELAAARLGTGTRFVSAQNHYNLLDRRAELEVLPAAKAFGLGVLPYFPLSNGLLTGKYAGGARPAGSRLVHSKPHLFDEAPWATLDALSDLAETRGIELIDLAIGWLLAQEPVTSVIAGASRPEQVRRNVRAAAWVPSAEDLAAIDAIVPPPPTVALF